MSIVRIHKQKNFSIISNRHLNDPVLSFKSKGILTYLLSKPDDWTIYTKQLVKTSKDGREAVYSGINELVTAGYIIKQQIRNSAGQMAGLEYIVIEDPENHVNQAVLPNPENPNPVNTSLLKTNKEPNTDLNDDVRPAPDQSPPDQPTTPPPSSSMKSEKPAQPPTPGTETAGTDDIEGAIASLVLLVPESMRKPSVIAKIARAVEAGLEISLIKGCIEYSNDHSDKKTWQRYRSHLGKCLDEKWGQGYTGEDTHEEQVAKAKNLIKARLDLPVVALKAMADSGDQYAVRALEIIQKE